MVASAAPISHADIVGVIGALQAAGATLTAEAVYREMRLREMPCRRSTVQAVVRAWHQQPQAAPVAPCAVAPPPPPPVSPLLARREGCTQHRLAVDRQRRALAQDEQALALEVSALRNDIREAARLTRQLRQAEAQAGSAVSLMPGEDAAAQRAQLRADLTALVGAVEVERVLADAQYTPWWLNPDVP